MIDHIIHFYQKGFFYTWHLELPYRLIDGDLIHAELLYNRGELQFNKELTNEFYSLDFHEYLFVERLEIDHNADVVAWLNIPTK